MALSYLFDPTKQFQDKNGVNNVYGFLYVFFNDSDDHAPTYCNFTGTFNPEKIVLDNNGRAVVIVDSDKVYRLEVYDRSGALMWTTPPMRCLSAGGTEYTAGEGIKIEDNVIGLD